MSVFKYALPVILSGFEETKDIDVSLYIQDATQALWCFYDIDGSEIVGAYAPINATTVRITIQPAPPQGTYKLVGIQ